MHHYVLNEKGEPVPEPDQMKWARWFETAERHVGNEYYDDVHISTVFLGLDHQYGEGPPILWETMLFCADENSELDQMQWRCSGSREQAEAMHAKAVEHVKNHMTLPGT